MSRAWTFAIVCFLLASSAHAEVRVVEELVARVDGHPIFLSEVRVRAKRRLKGGLLPVVSQSAYAASLEELIEERIASVLADQHELTVSDNEVDEDLRRTAAANKMPEDAVYAQALADGFSKEGYRDWLRARLLDKELARLLGRGRSKQQVMDEAKRRICIERLVRW